MDAVIVYESVLGSTQHVAEAVALGLEDVHVHVALLGTADADPERIAEAELLVVGGPTHLGTLPNAGTRAAARAVARTVADQDTIVDLVTWEELPAVGPGLRRWFHHLPTCHGRVAAAFDTRLPGERGAAGPIARRLGRHGYRVVSAEGFVVHDVLAHVGPDELERARRWGADLAHQLASALPR